MILYVIVFVVFVLMAISGYKKGASATLISLCLLFVSFVLATYLSELVTNAFYDNFVCTKIIGALRTYVSDAKEVILHETVDSLPPFVKALVDVTDYRNSSALGASVKNSGDTVAYAAENALRPLVCSFLSTVFSIVFFVIIYFIAKLLLLKPLNSVFRLPFVRTMDSVFGLVLSLFSSYLLVSFLAFILRILIPVTTNMPFFLTESTIYNSYIFYHFYSGNIFYNIISIF